MTDKQRISLMADLWPAACKAQGWKTSDRDLRLNVCSIALSFQVKSVQDFGNLFYSDAPGTRTLKSTNDIGHDEDFTRVKALCKMLADDLKGAQEVDKPQINKARQLRYVIGEQLKCVALYHANPQAYLQELIRDKFRHASRAFPLSLADLTDDPITLRDGREIPSQLRQIVMKLTANLNTFRKAAGHSEHWMKQQAGVKCRNTCKECHPCLIE